jgi:hypothetical protein
MSARGARSEKKADLARSVTVWYGEGSGGRYNTSAEMAGALGTRDGMLTKPAQPLDGFGIPTTARSSQAAWSTCTGSIAPATS